MMGAFAIVGFVVLPALLALDLLAPGRHFPGRRSGARSVAGLVAALAVGVGISAAVGLLAGEPSTSSSALLVLLVALGAALLDRLGGEALDGSRRPDSAPLTPAAWLDDRVAALVRRSLGGGLVLFGLLHLPVAAGVAGSLTFLAGSARAVAAAVATPVGFEEAAE